MRAKLPRLRHSFAFAAIGAAALLLIGAIGSRAAQPRECTSFKSQAAAQTYFVTAGGSPERPVGDLDPDHDGVACEELAGPYQGYATVGYNRKQHFFYGTATMPANPYGYSCMVGNMHYSEGGRIVNVYRVQPGASAKRVFNQFGLFAEPKPVSGRLVWKGKRTVGPGRYFAELEEQVRSTPFERSQCPSFRSRTVELP